MLSIAALALLPACGEAPRAPETPASSAEARSPFAVADSLRDEGRSQEALTLYRDLGRSFLDSGDTAGLWRAQHWEGDLLRRLGQRDSARAALARAMLLASGHPDREGWTRVALGQLLEREGKLDSALVEARRAIRLARSTGDRQLQAGAHDLLGTLHSLRGRYRESLAADSTALALHRAEGAPPRKIAQSLNEVGIGYRHLGRYTDAVRAYEEALGIARGLENPVLIAMLSYNLSNIRAATDDLDEAMRLLKESLRYSEQLQHPQGMGMTGNALGDLYRRTGNLRAARHHLEQGLEINRRSGFAYGELVARVHLGELETAERRPEAARAVLDSAVSIADASGFGRERVDARVALARVALLRTDPRQALRWAESAVQIADSLGDPEAQFEALEARGAALEAAGRAGAAGAYLQAIDLLESWRGRLALGDLRMGIAEPRHQAYEGAIRVLLRQQRPQEALEVAERARARLLLELMAERDAREAPASRGVELRQRLRERFAALERARPEEKPAVEREVARLTEALEALEAEARRQDRARGAVRYPEPASLPDIRAGLAFSGRAVLAYFWGDQGVYGWWITENSLHAARLGSADSLAALVGFLRRAVEHPSHGVDWTAPARRAYRALVAPLDPTPAGEIVVLPSGPLAHLPFEVLIPEAAAGPWGTARRFVYGPSASVLLALAGAPAPESWGRTILAVGDPALPRNPGSDAQHGVRTDPLLPLPHAAAEARDVARLFRAGGADVLLGRHATRERWLELDPARYRYLHFAAHARVDDRRPERTHVVLAGQPLDLAAIRRLRLRSELVTLSACETALGRRLRGEGVIGLPHAFLAAGARGVVVTLWRIDDRSTARFMGDFYRELHAGRDPADALLRARRARITAGGAEAHPSRWAPFVLTGGIGPPPD